MWKINGIQCDGESSRCNLWPINAIGAVAVLLCQGCRLSRESFAHLQIEKWQLQIRSRRDLHSQWSKRRRKKTSGGKMDGVWREEAN